MRLHTRLHVLCLCRHAKPPDSMSLVSLSTCGVSFSVFSGMAVKEQTSSSLDDAPSLSWTIEQLRKFLRQYGARLAGNKKDLLERYVCHLDTISLCRCVFVLADFYYCFVFLMLSRALFYQKTPDAAPSAKRKCVADVVEHKAEVEDFPITGWTTEPSQYPRVTVATILGHLVNTGKNVSLLLYSDNNDSY